MADWSKILSRGNVEDRRSSTAAKVGGLSIGGVALLFVVSYLNTGSLGDSLQQVGSQVINQQMQQMQSGSGTANQFAGDPAYKEFASEILGSNNDLWHAKFNELNASYTDPTLVLFRGATESGCGGATSDAGPHYCPSDQTIYLDETFFDELTQRYGAKGGDVAQAYVISHEVGHHVQNSLGTLDRVEDGSNATSVKTELQADCYAGIWANSIKDRGILQPGEIGEAMDAASAVGDDRIQRAAQGYVSPESFTHGTSAERVKWFTTGYDTGSVDACDTFL